MQPIVLPPNVLDHFYLGGAQIAALRGLSMPSAHRPEEWLAATTHMSGTPDIGLSRTTAGDFLRDRITDDPIGWVGSQHGPSGDSGLLVKLLDAGQRLPVHVHPDRPFAQRHLRCPYGKTEAWFVLATSGQEPSVWLGWKDDVDPTELRARVDSHDSAWMLSRMNQVAVRAGDGILVPAGTVHAIGEGVFVAEVQEPTDFSIFLEWPITTAKMDESYLGLGLPLALTATNLGALPGEGVADLVLHTDPAQRGSVALRLLPVGADPFFRLHLLSPAAGTSPGLPAGFAVGIVVNGCGELTSSRGDAMPVERGQVVAIPAGYGDWAVSGDVQLIACRSGAGWPETLGLGSDPIQPPTGNTP